MNEAPTQSESNVSAPLNPLLRDFLAWVGRRPRLYAEAMEAWQTSCPRFTIWEDALGDRLIALAPGCGALLGEMAVALTPRGCALLATD